MIVPSLRRSATTLSIPRQAVLFKNRDPVEPIAQSLRSAHSGNTSPDDNRMPRTSHRAQPLDSFRTSAPRISPLEDSKKTGHMPAGIRGAEYAQSTDTRVMVLPGGTTPGEYCASTPFDTPRLVRCAQYSLPLVGGIFHRSHELSPASDVSNASSRTAPHPYAGEELPLASLRTGRQAVMLSAIPPDTPALGSREQPKHRKCETHIAAGSGIGIAVASALSRTMPIVVDGGLRDGASGEFDEGFGGRGAYGDVGVVEEGFDCRAGARVVGGCEDHEGVIEQGRRHCVQQGE